MAGVIVSGLDVELALRGVDLSFVCRTPLAWSMILEGGVSVLAPYVAQLLPLWAVGHSQFL
jgi:hypothetical protein